MAIRKFHWSSVHDCVMHETDGLGNTLVEYTHEPSPYGPLISENRGGDEYVHHYDALGSTTMLTDETESVSDTFKYDAWGNEVARTGTTDTPYRWVGRWGYQFDESTESYYVRARVYQPAITRWTSMDPLGFQAVFNMYEYVNNVPVHSFDPSGLISKCVVCKWERYSFEDYLIADMDAEFEMGQNPVSRAVKATWLDRTSGQGISPSLAAKLPMPTRTGPITIYTDQAITQNGFTFPAGTTKYEGFMFIITADVCADTCTFVAKEYSTYYSFTPGIDSGFHKDFSDITPIAPFHPALPPNIAQVTIGKLKVPGSNPFGPSIGTACAYRIVIVDIPMALQVIKRIPGNVHSPAYYQTEVFPQQIGLVGGGNSYFLQHRFRFGADMNGKNIFNFWNIPSGHNVGDPDKDCC